MAYVGQGIKNGTFSVLDTSGNTYNGSNVTFNLGTQVSSPAQLLVSHDGVIQKPVTDYTIATGGTQITFTTAPASGASIFITEISGAVGAPMNRDINGDELILDADGDTSLHCSTDDQIDFRIAGADDLRMSANAVNVLSGTTLTIDSGATITNSGTANGFSGAADNYFASSGLSSKDLGAGLHIKISDSSATVHSSADELIIERNGDNGMTFLNSTSGESFINFGDSGDNDIGQVRYHHDTNHMAFVTNANERMRMLSDGNIVIGKTSATFETAGHSWYGVSGDVGKTEITSEAGTTPLLCNRLDDGNILALFSAGSVEGTIAISGTTTAYNTFCGAHWSRLADNSKPTILRGTVIESIATMVDWHQAVATDSDGNKIVEDIALPNGKSAGDAVTFTSRGKEYTGVYAKEDNEQLPMCKISDTADSKSVYGVFMCWDDRDDGLDNDVNDMNVASLGAFIVRIHKDQTVAIGDYLVSNGDGTAKKQADDILRSSTIAKVTSTTKTITHADGSYCVPCTLHCG